MLNNKDEKIQLTGMQSSIWYKRELTSMFVYSYHYFPMFDKEASLWKAESTTHKNFVATSEAPFVTMLIGTHPWTIHNDSTFCKSGQTYTR
jgi:calcineurin-like phosphoesterase